MPQKDCADRAGAQRCPGSYIQRPKDPGLRVAGLYETAIEEKNGFVCMVERSWISPFNSTEFWNPKVRADLLQFGGRAIHSASDDQADGDGISRVVESSDDRQHQGRI